MQTSNDKLFHIALTEAECEALRTILLHADYDISMLTVSTDIAVLELLHNLIVKVSSASFNG